MLKNLLQSDQPVFRDAAAVQELIRHSCESSHGLAFFHKLGESEQGRPIDAVTMGSGKRLVSLMAGAHADEPVGPETLRHLIIEGLQRPEVMGDLLNEFTFVIFPQINPDGEAANRAWAKNWPDYSTCFEHVRELPGRDMEFGYPAMRRENQLVHDFLLSQLKKSSQPGYSLHLSLHGMSVAEGCMLLIEKHWIDRSVALRERWVQMVQAYGYELHDHDRAGEKGFQYIGPGFTTTPEGGAMRKYFEGLGDIEMAGKFHDSSMEAIRKMGGDPLCLVTEIPLYVIRGAEQEHQPGVPVKYLRYRDEKVNWTARYMREEVPREAMREFGLEPVDLKSAIDMQLATIEMGLACLDHIPGETPLV